MYIRTEEQISELLTKMVERNASDEDLAGGIRYSATYISGRNSLDKIDLYFNEVLYQDRNPQARSEADGNYQIVSGRSKLYELLE